MIEKKLSNATPLDDENVVLRRSDNNFLNKTQITNCILEAPNGVATYSGSTITVKQGLKVLTPNGRNADGTLNNIEHTTPNDISRTVITSVDNVYIAFISVIEDGYAIGYVPLNTYYESSVKPTSSTARRWLDTENNYFYILESGEPEQLFSTKVLTFVVKDGQITSFTPYQPVELAKQQDIDGMWVHSLYTVLGTFTNFTPNQQQTFSLTDLLPNDGNLYEVVASCACLTSATSGQTGILYVRSDANTEGLNAIGGQTRTNSTMTYYGNVRICAREYITLINTGTGAAKFSMTIKAYRKVR